MPHLAVAKYGKDKVRVFRVVRNADGKHDVAEYIVKCLVEGEVEKAWTESDNSSIVATDSIKNTINVFAKKSPYVLQPETFALELGLHFVNTYSHLHRVSVDVTQSKWSRIPVRGQPHKHSFVRNGEEKRFTSVVVDASKGVKNVTATCESGIKDLLVLKSTGSSFENYVFDDYTTLKPVDDRIFSTSVECTYTIPIATSALTVEALPRLGIDFEGIFANVVDTTLEIFAEHNSASVQATLYIMGEKVLKDNKHVNKVHYELPNKHYIPAILPPKLGLKNLETKDAEVFTPVDAPSGHIVGVVTRDPVGKL
ncbi:uncharacterized protein JCM15063_002463 [Sporobolomyces koalae]|uniref:uncharacterized protein n=1 Tax=Sporobolomyces koalae TaxID=500713 RepID=UPI0031768ABE